MYPHPDPSIFGVPVSDLLAVAAVLSPLVALVVALASLRHARKLKDRELRMQLRREVFLEAASAVSELQSLLGRLSNLEVDDADLGAAFAAGQAKIAKVHIVGSPATIAAVMQFMSVMGPAFIDLISRRPALQRQRMFAQSTAAGAAAASELSNKLSTMLGDAYAEEKDAQKVADLAQQLKRANERHRIEQTNLHVLNLQLVYEISQLGSRCIKAAERLTRILPTAAIAIRAEMDDRSLNETEYRAQWEAQLTLMTDAWERARSRILAVANGETPDDDDAEPQADIGPTSGTA